MTTTLIQGDCLKEMDKLIQNNQKVNLILTDPPYLIDYSTGFRKDQKHKLSQRILNDDNPQLIADFLPLCYELLMEGSAFYCFCSEHYLDYFKQEIEKHFNIKNICVWIKNNGSGLGDLKGSYVRTNEFIIFATKGRHLLKGKRDPNIFYYPMVSPNNRLHSNQKPIDLLEFIINKSSNPNDTVLDCFMGSGSTGVACQNTNRNFIGIELDPTYYQIAQERINETKKQTKLM